jgi:LEA14-like dessication related protein
MRVRSASYIISAAIFVYLLAGCQAIKAPELVSVNITELNRAAGDGSLKVELTYSNPNGKALTIKQVNVNGMINQKSIGDFKLSKRGRINARAEEIVELHYRFDPDEIYPGFLSRKFGVIGSKRVRITLEGESVFLKQDKEVSVPVDYSEVYKIPD